MQPDRKIGMLLTELGIEGDLKESIRNLLLDLMDAQNKRFNTNPSQPNYCRHCNELYFKFPHYCNGHITVSHQTRYWIDDQAYNASHRIPNCS